MGSESEFEDDPASRPGPGTPKKKKLQRGELSSSQRPKHRAQKFRQEWLAEKDFKDWLQPVRGDNSKGRCKNCDVTFVAEITNIKRHGSGAKHRRLVSSATVRQPLISNFTATPKVDIIDRKVASAEIQLAAFMAEHNLSFNVAEHLTDLLKNIFRDHEVAQKMSMKRTKAGCIVTNVIAPAHKDDLANKLKGRKFSVLTDESTDIGSVKSSCIVVRYFDSQSGRIESKFWNLRDLFNPSSADTGASAANLFDGLINSFKDFNIPLENIIGFAADGCNVMMGENNSVSSRLKEACPGIVIMKCICHSAHLCANEACKTLPRSCEDMARDIYNFFKCSAKRQSELRQFQEFVNVEPLKMLHPSQTRWLSLVAVVDRILDHWNALNLYFTDSWLAHRLLSAENLFNALNDPFMKLYYMFLSWILPKFTKFNEFFQTKKVAVTELHQKLTDLYREILLCFMEREYIMKTPLDQIDPALERYYLPDRRMYLGVKVMQNMDNPEIAGRPDLLKHFIHRTRNFFKVAAQEIKKRYNMKDPVLSKLSVLQPKAALSPAVRDRWPSLLPLITEVPRVVSPDNHTLIQAIDDQWRELPFACARFTEDIGTVVAPDEFWAKLLEPARDMDVAIFKELATFALDVLCLPHSNADCERVFSQVNLTKTKTRNRLVTRNVNGALLASQCVKEGGTCTSFQPSPAMLTRMESTILYGGPSTSSKTDMFVDYESDEDS